MKLQFMSDLHINNYNQLLKVVPAAPNLALIGDICDAYNPKLYKFLTSIVDKFERIFYTPGNHEYYRNYLEHTDIYLFEMCKEIGIEFLQKETVEVDGVLLSGCTLWSNPSPEGFHKTNDPRWIKNFTREKMILEHRNHIRFLDEAIEANKSKKPHVILTHYAPLFEMNGRFQDGPNTDMFASDMSHLFYPPVKYWLCGHVHQNLTVLQNNIPCISNCFGDPEELDVHETFEREKTIEVEGFSRCF